MDVTFLVMVWPPVVTVMNGDERSLLLARPEIRFGKGGWNDVAGMVPYRPNDQTHTIGYC